jgi:hypothetical protein
MNDRGETGFIGNLSSSRNEESEITTDGLRRVVEIEEGGMCT